jgi:hypothetical protein
MKGRDVKAEKEGRENISVLVFQGAISLISAELDEKARDVRPAKKVFERQRVIYAFRSWALTAPNR